MVTMSEDAKSEAVTDAEDPEAAATEAFSQPPIPEALRSFHPVLVEDGRYKGLPLHFGWPANEQDSFEKGLDFAYLGQPGLVKVVGPDRLTWLTTLGSQIVTNMEVGDSKEMLLLDPQGRVSFQMAVSDDGEATWLLTEPQFASALAEFLRSMQFLLRVEIADESARFRTVVTDNQGEETAQALTRWVTERGGYVWTDPWPGVTEGGSRYFTGPHPASSELFRLYVVPEEESEDFLNLLLTGDLDMGREKMGTSGLLAVEAVRIASWRPLLGSEVDARTLPAELDWLRTAVHVEKGCYCGQESVARILNLGKPPRRLVFLQLDGSAETLPQRGAAVEFNGRTVGTLTSVARHWEMGPIGLALVKRALDPTVQLTVEGIDAAQEIIVPIEGRSDHSPKQRPGAGLRRLDPGKRDIRTRGPGAGG